MNILPRRLMPVAILLVLAGIGMLMNFHRGPGDGICATSPGVYILRVTLQEASALAGADTIIVPTVTYALTIPGRGERTAAASGDLDITGDKNITGAGAKATTVQAWAPPQETGSCSGIDRVNENRNPKTGEQT